VILHLLRANVVLMYSCQWWSLCTGLSRAKTRTERNCAFSAVGNELSK